MERVRRLGRRARRWSSAKPRAIFKRGRRARFRRPFSQRKSSVSVPHRISGKDGGILLICDHASNAVPGDVDLDVDAALLDKHIAVDIGAGPLTRALAARLEAPAILATVSRLVIDL